MTLQLLWHEYVASTDGKSYSYSALCEHYCVFQASVTSHFRQMTGHFRVSVTACFRFSVTAFVLSPEMRFA
jgi:hypothetical protein